MGVSAVKKKRVLFVSYSLTGDTALRLFASILKNHYNLTFVFIDNLSYMKGSLEHLGERVESLVKFCKDYDYILFSTTHYHADLTFRLADSIKKANPGAWVIIGGHHAISHPAQCLKHADYVCVFEGEDILEFLRHLDENLELKSFGNFVCRAEDIGGSLTWVKDLDSLPIPDYQAGRHYLYTPSGIIPINQSPEQIHYEVMRGCPYQCSFCGNAVLNRLKRTNKIPLLRFKSMATVLRHLEELKSQLPNLRAIELVSDNIFCFSLEELETFAATYDQSVDVPLDLQGDLRSPDFCTKVQTLARIDSLRTFGFGIQSGSEEFNRRVYNRHQKNADIVKRHEYMKGVLKDSVIITYDIIFGHPEETRDDVLDTINLMLKLVGARFILAPFIPLYGPAMGRSYSTVDYVQLKRFPFYYFMMFLIKYLRTYRLGFLFPGELKVTRFTELFNSSLFSKIYFSIMNFSIWFGELKGGRK